MRHSNGPGGSIAEEENEDDGALNDRGEGEDEDISEDIRPAEGGGVPTK
jgi:hypothetical protein